MNLGSLLLYPRALLTFFFLSVYLDIGKDIGKESRRKKIFGWLVNFYVFYIVSKPNFPYYYQALLPV